MSQLFLPDEAATGQVGARLAAAVGAGLIVFLEGDLGSGKTCLCRGILRGLGYEGPVKSPTFTVVEPYEIAHLSIYHIDLYRLSDPQELEYIGIEDYFNDGLCLVEWPERGKGVLPVCDLRIRLQPSGAGRILKWQSESPQGLQLSDCLQRQV